MKRPLLTIETRADLRKAADEAERYTGPESTNRAYARGVADVLRWLDGGDESPLLKEVTR